MKVHKVIKIFIQFCLIVFSVESFANFGDSCVALPSFGTDSYLSSSTAYGHVVNSIDMLNPNLCDKDDQQFRFCLKNKDGSPERCEIVAMNLNQSRRLGDLSPNNPDLGGSNLLKDIILKVEFVDKGLLCLTMSTSRGRIAVACKSTNIPAPPIPPDEQCRNIAKVCYLGSSRSQSLFNFSGLAVDCVKETLDAVFFRYNNCDQRNEKVSLMGLNPFSTFQESLKISIRAALILYVMFFAVNMILNKEYGNLDKIATFIMKLILVAYFAVGLGPIYFKDGKETTNNGMMQYGLPLLNELTPKFAQIIFNAGSSRGLCEFDSKKYKEGYSFYALWDAVDCRIAYYLGMGLLYNTESILGDIPYDTLVEKGDPINISSQSDKTSPDDLRKVGSLRFFTVMFGFLMSGNIIIVASGIIFSVIFISIILYFITHYLVCMITIYVMTYISPIFIPMALFTRTKAYFDAWLKICISCAIQPAVMAGFIALLLTMYDSAIYKNCEFMRYDYNYDSDVKFATFELRLPKTDVDQCKNSVGYKMLQYYSGLGWEKHLLILFPIKSIALDILTLFVDLLYVLVFSVIFYYFSKFISQFAADVTSGPPIDAVISSPTKMFDFVKKGVEYLNDATKGGAGKGEQSKDLIGKGRKSLEEGAKDSSSGGESGDIVGAGKEGVSGGKGGA